MIRLCKLDSEQIRGRHSRPTTHIWLSIKTGGSSHAMNCQRRALKKNVCIATRKTTRPTAALHAS